MNKEIVTKYTLPLGGFKVEGERVDYLAELEVELRKSQGRNAQGEEFEFVELSICGGYWPKGRRETGWSGGQCGERLAELMKGTRGGWIMKKVLPIWDRWHLNGFRAGCQHQRASWETSKQIELVYFGWSDSFFKMRRMAADGELSPLQYEDYKRIAGEVDSVHKVKWLSPEVAELVRLGYLKEKKRETKGAGWVYPSEHPDGLLCKPCDVCGYKYGSAWLAEKLPPDVLGLVMDRFRLGVMEPAEQA